MIISFAEAIVRMVSVEFGGRALLEIRNETQKIPRRVQPLRENVKMIRHEAIGMDVKAFS
jgi:hypothetical protein